MVDTVNDLDNVLYEACNEAGADSKAWQYHVIDFVHRYEAGKPKQHPVGMTFQYPGGTNQMLIDSPADWISPNPGTPKEGYKDNPSARYVGKVIVNDTDHLWGHQGGDNVWVWRSFLRGLNVLFMEELLPSPTWQDSARDAMGQVRRFSRKIDLARMVPVPELVQTGYVLADRGREYLAFQDGGQGEFWIELKDTRRDVRRRVARRDDRQGRARPADRGRGPSAAHDAVPGAGGRPRQAVGLAMIVAACEADARRRTEEWGRGEGSRTRTGCSLHRYREDKNRP